MYSWGNRSSCDRRRRRCGSGRSRSATSFFLFPTLAGVREPVQVMADTVRYHVWTVHGKEKDSFPSTLRAFCDPPPKVCVMRPSAADNSCTYWCHRDDGMRVIMVLPFARAAACDRAGNTVAAGHMGTHKHKHIQTSASRWSSVATIIRDYDVVFVRDYADRQNWVDDVYTDNSISEINNKLASF